MTPPPYIAFFIQSDNRFSSGPGISDIFHQKNRRGYFVIFIHRKNSSGVIFLSQQSKHIEAHSVKISIFRQINTEIAINGSIYRNYIFSNPNRLRIKSIQRIHGSNAELSVVIKAISP